MSNSATLQSDHPLESFYSCRRRLTFGFCQRTSKFWRYKQNRLQGLLISGILNQVNPMQNYMQTMNVQIIPFDEKYQQAIEDLVLPIQQSEFGVRITRDEQTDLIDITGTFQKGNGNFWVALREGKVVGSIGVVDIGNGQVALKKMFVNRQWRGREHSVGASLMECAKNWCREKSVKQIFLGTTAQMLGARRFYEKNNFAEVDKDELPSAFPTVHVDSKFYRCDL